MLPTRTLVGAMTTAVVIGLSLAGCGSSDPDYYTLKPWPGPAQGGGPSSLKIRTPSVAGYLDRDYIVGGDQDYRLTLEKHGAWGEPLADMIGQTLASDLQQRLPGTNVFTAAGAISTDAQATVELDVSRFSKTADGQVELAGSLLVKPAGTGSGAAAPVQALPLHLSTTPQGAGVSGEVAGLSLLLGQVADQAARQARQIGAMPVGLSAAPTPGMPDGAGPVPDAVSTPVPVALAPR